MKIAVTGGLGALGAPLVSKLGEMGHDVWVVDRPLWHGEKYVRADVGEFRQIQVALESIGPELVYNLAAEFGRHVGEDFYETMWRSNAVGTKNVIRLQEAMGFRLVQMSSSEIYGDYYGMMNEVVADVEPLFQHNDYAISKWVNELQVRNSMREFGTETVILRPFNTYGPGERYSPYRSVICKFVYQALHDLPSVVWKSNMRTSTYIDDMVRTIANVSENFRPGEAYNIAGSTYHSIEYVMRVVQRNVPSYLDDLIEFHDELEPGNTIAKQVVATKARDHLGHVETVDLEEGIARTVAWQRKVYGL